MNKKCIDLSEEQYKECISLLRTGFTLDGVRIRPNPRIATIAVVQTCLGLRLGDVLQLKMTSFVFDGTKWKLDIVEQKTKKARPFTVPVEVYSFIQQYAYENGIGKEAKLFDISARQVERHLNKVFTKMGLPVKRYGSHSFRKLFATKVYVENGYDLLLTQKLLQHSSPAITQLYIGVSQKKMDDALLRAASCLV